MCIAILNNGNKITKEQFKNSWDNNPDGFGMAYVYANEIRVFKSMSKNIDKLYKRYSRIYDKIDSPIMLHFRISTGGKINLANCHPFMVNDETVFMHNGVINGFGNKVYNDTIDFNNKVLYHFDFNTIKTNKGLNTLIEETIGYSKLVFLNANKDYHIINPEMGHFDKSGNWFSNDTYKTCDYGYDFGFSYGKTTTYKTDGNYRKVESKKVFCESCLQVSDNVKTYKDWNCKMCNDCADYYGVLK